MHDKRASNINHLCRREMDIRNDSSTARFFSGDVCYVCKRNVITGIIAHRIRVIKKDDNTSSATRTRRKSTKVSKVIKAIPGGDFIWVSFSFNDVTHQQICWHGMIIMKRGKGAVLSGWNFVCTVSKTIKHVETDIGVREFHFVRSRPITCLIIKCHGQQSETVPWEASFHLST